jgi:hypothetical protein
MKPFVAQSLLGASLLGALFVPARANAQDARSFAEKGSLVVAADRLLPLISYSSATVTNTVAGQTFKSTDSASSIALLIGHEPANGLNPHTVPRIAVDYAVVNHLTLGGAFVLAFGLGASHTKSSGSTNETNDSPKSTVVGFAPRVVYYIPFSSSFGFWPRAGFAFYSVSEKAEDTLNSTVRRDSIWSIDLDPQLTWVPVHHLVVHVGPLLNAPLGGSRSVETTSTGGRGSTVSTSTTAYDLSIFHVGLSAGIGGFFDL